MEILAVRDLTFAYAGQEKNTLKDLSFSLEKESLLRLWALPAAENPHCCGC